MPYLSQRDAGSVKSRADGKGRSPIGDRPARWVDQTAGRSNSPAWTPAMKPAQSGAPNESTGPAASLESRTSTVAGAFATSTQCPAAPLRVLLRQVRVASFIVFPFLIRNARPFQLIGEIDSGALPPFQRWPFGSVLPTMRVPAGHRGRPGRPR